MSRWYLTGFLALLAAACKPASAEGQSPAASASAEAHAPTESAKKAEPEASEGHQVKRIDPNRTYTLPFVREQNADDPVDRARALLHDVVHDNAFFMRSHDSKFFKPFAESQKPRATIVTCADSQVQTGAIDTTPENDLFTVRNLANQIKTSAGSVDYGVTFLKTPVLVVLGHAGCTSIKTAMGDLSQQSPGVRHELEALDLSPANAKGGLEKKEGHGPEKRPEIEKGRPVDSQSLTEAVLNNVHHQVAAALAEYAERVASHELIVVGAVYDTRDDMRKGYGSFNIVNVNGHTESSKITAFVKALDERPTSVAAAVENAASRFTALAPPAAPSAPPNHGH